MATRCSICKKTGKKNDKLLSCSGDCGERFHSECAVTNFDLSISSLDDESIFLCSACTLHSCKICKLPITAGEKSLVCTGDCNGHFHSSCAARPFGLNLADPDHAIDFRCDLCLMQRSSVTPRTPIGSQHTSITDNHAQQFFGNNNDPRFDELMAQMKLMSTMMTSQFVSIHESMKLSGENFGRRMDNLEGKLDQGLSSLSSEVKEVVNRVTVLEKTSEISQDLINRVTHLEVSENNSAALANRVNRLETSTIDSDKLSISGVPLDTGDSPRKVVEKVFTALGIPEAISKVDEINLIPRKGNKPEPIGNTTSVNSAPPSGSGTIMVSMISQTQRDRVASTKRNKKKLLVRELWSLSHPSHPGQLFINEVLPQATYNLYRKVKAKARQTHSSVWLRGGLIHARKSHGAPEVLISSESDLAMLD